MKIRAHHLLCIQGFQGHGYSAEFAENMSKVICSLKSNPQQEIEIVDECDVICKFCPHKKEEGRCKNIISNLMIKRIDRKVIKKLEIDYSTIISAESIISLTQEVFKTQKDVQGICRNCRWKKKCLWYLSKI
jgi:hypothetical protein